MGTISSGLKVSMLSKFAVFFIIISFVTTPLASIFAQETPPPTETEIATPPSTETEIITPETELTTPPVTEEIVPSSEEVDQLSKEKKLKEEKELKPKDEEVMSMGLMMGPLSQLGDISESHVNRLSSQVDNISGALIYKYDLVVPPGRNKMTPNLSLVYNSTNAATDSVVGAGWEINIPYIQRVPKKGTDKLYSENYFVSSLDGELILVSGSTYAAKNENGDFRKYDLTSNVWTVTDKEGTVYKYGTNAAERQDNSADTSKVFKWMLQEARDTNDNFITYTYYKNTGQIYPEKITYTGNASTAGIFDINFVRESRSNAPNLFNAGFSVKSAYRISEINTEVSDSWVRKYTLSYTTGDNGSGSLLNTIVEAGRDEGGTTTTLPAVDFNYNTAPTDWTYNSNWNIPYTSFINSGTDYGLRLADINGDGLLDFLCHNDNSSSSYACYRDDAEIQLNNGNGWTNADATWQFPIMGDNANKKEFFTDSSFADSGLRAIDVNGDQKVDLVRGKGNRYTYINNGSGWTVNSTWEPPIPFIHSNADSGMRMADINGDGLVDILCHTERTNDSYCDLNDPKIYLNNGAGWTNASSTWLFPIKGDDANKRESFLNSSGTDLGLRLLDVNGDNLPDLVRSAGGSTYTYLNNGSGWTIESTNFSWPITFANGNTDSGVRVADMNGDGLLDVLCHNSDSSGVSCPVSDPEILVHNGLGWTNADATWQFPVKQDSSPNVEILFSGTAEAGRRFLDVNGDGLDDLVRAYNGTNYTYLNNEDVPTNLLTQITYSQGGTTDITYKSTAQMRDGSNNLYNPSLPIYFHAVSNISTTDGATPMATAYTYEGGLYYFNTYLDRKFAGFSSIIATDSAGNVKKTYYHQGNSTNTSLGEYDDHVSKIGKVYRVEEYNNSSNLFKLTVDKVDKYNIAGDRNFVKVVRRTTLDYDGDSDHADTAQEYIYDNTYGNLTEKIDWGKVTASTDGSFTDTGSDKSTETITYVANTTPYIVGLPYQDTVVDQSSAKVRESKIYYDAQSLGSVTDGNVTKIEDWVTGSTYINNQKAYNTTYGIVTSETDPRGKVTSYSYDSYNLYPAAVTNPLSQVTDYTYDYSLGKSKQVTDQNDFVYQTVYDGLDRVLEEKVPGFGSPYTPVTKIEYAYTDTSGSVKVQKTDHLDGSTSRVTHQYFDNLGRLIQERKEAETDFNVRDIAYNNRGLVLKESMPYTSSGSSKTSATGTSTLYTDYTYDALKRPATVVSPLGTTSYAYDDWKTTITDAESNVKHYYKDAFGNLIKVDEVNGGSTYTTNYEYNLNNKLTKITDASSNLRNFTYDGLGRRLTAEDLHASGDSTFGSWTYAYDNSGNMTQSVNPRSHTVNYTYDDINRVSTEDYTGAGGTEVSYTYDSCTNGVGKLCSTTSGANMSFTYNSNGQVASEAKIINSTTYTTSYTYDRQGNTLTITYPDSAEVKYTFNTAGLLNKIERKESGGSFTDVVSNFDYSPMDQVTTQSDVNGVTTTNTYDAAKMYRLTRRLTQNTVPYKHQDLNYTYDNVNNITQIVDSSSGSGSKTVAYVYDDLNRMTSATATGVAGGQSTYTHTYTYDALGNITSGPIGSYTYAGNTGVLTANPHAATTINSVTYTYDASGNLTGNGTLTNTWNYKDQLTQTVNGGTTVTYEYDHNGDRTRYNNGTISTSYPNKFYNYDGTKKTKQIYAGDSLVATVETVSSVVTPYYAHIDHLGSTTNVSNGSGTSVQTLDYFPFGDQRINSGSYQEQKKYVGLLRDTDTGLDYANARYYEGSTGRFISQDPMFLLVGSAGFADRWKTNWRDIKTGDKVALYEYLSNPQNLNSYSYGLNNPITMSDPNGDWAVHFDFTTNAGLGGEVGNAWSIGFASDGTFGVSSSLHGGGLAGVDASIGVAAGYSNAKTWSDTLGTGQYTSVGGKIIYGGGITTNFSGGKYTGTDVGIGVGLRTLPDIPVAFSGGVNKTTPVFQGNVSGIVSSVKGAATYVANSVSSAASTVRQNMRKLINKLKSK